MTLPAPSAVDLADLRRRIETAFTRDGGGGYPRVAICPVCQEDRGGEAWFGRRTDPDAMCQRCRDEGYYPGERREKETLMPGNANAGECPHCHVYKSNLWDHGRRCKLNPANGTLGVVKLEEPDPPREEIARLEAKQADLVKEARDFAPCVPCPGAILRGLNPAALKAVELMVRGGSGLQQAAELVRKAQGSRK